MNIIQSQGVTKLYGRKKVLDRVDLCVERGKIFALLGPNGAGKTTLVKIMLDLVRPDSGSVSIAGVDSRNRLCRSNLAYMPEKFAFFPYYTAANVMSFYGRMHGIRGAELHNRTAEVLERLDIAAISRQRVRTLSKGQMQRLGIAGLVLSGADLMIFDEPFSGLDPIGIRDIKKLFLELRDEGKTIFINSHILSEVEQVGDQIAILHEGVCLAQGPLNELKGENNLEDFFYNTVKG